MLILFKKLNIGRSDHRGPCRIMALIVDYVTLVHLVYKGLFDYCNGLLFLMEKLDRLFRK